MIPKLTEEERRRLEHIKGRRAEHHYNTSSPSTSLWGDLDFLLGLVSQPTSCRLTILVHSDTAVYLGDDLVWESRETRVSTSLLEALGFEVERIRVRWEEMPGTPSRPAALKTLTEMKAYLKNLEQTKRRKAIEDCEAELVRLRKAEEADGGQ